jgi:excisionase family DNA binding protein
MARHMEASEPQVLTVDEVATLLRLDRKTIYHAIAGGEIPAVRIRRRLLVPRVALDKLMAGEVKPAA